MDLDVGTAAAFQAGGGRLKSRADRPPVNPYSYWRLYPGSQET